MNRKGSPTHLTRHPALPPTQTTSSRRVAVAALSLALLSATTASAQTFTWNNTAGGTWSTATNWTPNTVPNSTSSIALFDSPAAYNVDVDGQYNLLAFQIGPNQTGALNVRETGTPPPTRQIVLTPGVGANGSIAVNNGLTTLYVQNSGAVTHTIRPSVFLGGGSSGSPVNHVWEVQGPTAVTVTGQIQATTSSNNTITKVGTGTLAFTANNAGLSGWSGGLIVNGGTVQANALLNSTGLGPVTVNTGGTLGGRGQINHGAGTVLTTVNTGGTLLPGTGAGNSRLTITAASSSGGLTMNANSTLAVRLFGTGTDDIGRVDVNGTTVINTNQISLDLSVLNVAQRDQLRSDVGIGNSRTYRVLTSSNGNGLSGSGFNAAGFTVSNPGAFNASEWSFGTFDTVGDGVVDGFVTVRFTPVPEPHTVFALAAMTMAGWTAVRRYRAKTNAEIAVL